MLTIRLRRAGGKKDPHFRVVVADRAAGRDGPFLEILGHYHPRQRPAEIHFDMERTATWLGQGARMSDTVHSLYRRVLSGRVEKVPETPPAAVAPTPDPSDAELEAAAEVEAEAETETEAAAAGTDADEQSSDTEVSADADTAEEDVEEDSGDDESASDDASGAAESDEEAEEA